MHELPMTERLLEIVLEHAGGARVTDVHLRIGELSGFAEECVLFHWQVLSRGTGAERSRLHFRHTPFVMRCLRCGSEWRPGGRDYACAACGSDEVRVAGGEEMLVEAIDVEDREAVAPAGGPRMRRALS